MNINEVPCVLLETKGRCLEQDGENSYVPFLFVAGRTRGKMIWIAGVCEYRMIFFLENALRYFEKKWPFVLAAPEVVSGAEILVVRSTETGRFKRNVK